MTLSQYYDIETRLAAAAIALLAADGIVALHYLHGEPRAHQRVEVEAALTRAADRWGIDTTGDTIRIGWELMLTLDIVTPLALPAAAHGELRGHVRALFREPHIQRALRPHLPAANLAHLAPADAPHSLYGGESEPDERSTRLSYAALLLIHPTARPIE